MKGALIWCPFPDETAALAAVDTLLHEGLVACGNLVPGMTSVFIWNGERCTAREVGALFKTTDDRLEEAITRLGQVHPYDEPAVFGWVCDGTAPATLSWLAGAVAKA
ncbi:divalent-cation tolerance protein CutA [Novosphingobium panipatense]|uniref:Divalent cation tolerance protein n=1 Tax=Novosphingobium panipatense TaxID=428991 RepID=A0ABY1QEY5_9SPHN|nr:divalent-cation tolerance protein CutA [Novosphingobium panipatense]SMP67215.1 divalent cation tolerance protein [Novosphingobium panipatense]